MYIYIYIYILILSGPCAVATGTCGFMRINKGGRPQKRQERESSESLTQVSEPAGSQRGGCSTDSRATRSVR